jgi:hypothetical protein
MKLTFLQAAGGLRLAKKISLGGTTPYPNAKSVTSLEYNIDKTDLPAFEAALREQAELGHCLLKGPLRGPLKNESRKGASDNIAFAEFLVIDADNVMLDGMSPYAPITEAQVAQMAGRIVSLLPPVFHNVSYIAQASASLGLKGARVSMHIYFVLETPLPPKSIKLWLRHVNLTVPEFNSQLGISATGAALKYVIDPSVADNSKLIFIAPPSFVDGAIDPFADKDARIVRIDKAQTTIELSPEFAKINPELLNTQISDKRDELRARQGLPKKKSKTTFVSHAGENIEVVTNPDRVSIAIVEDGNYPFVRCNINGGDSNAYWFNVDDPTYMFNFKDEPAFEIQKADPDFYATLFERYAAKGAKDNQPLRPVVMRDFNTDTYWNGVFDPNKNQFTDEYPLTNTSRGSVESFMRSHGRAAPPFIPDAKVVFEPSRIDDEIQLETPPYYVNMYTRTPYMLKATNPAGGSLRYGTGIEIQKHCPTIYKIMFHMLGSSAFETEHFINWLAFIYQKKTKAMTAWVLTGVPGTGKGLFVNKVLKPLFGDQHVPMRALENIEEQYNSFMRSAIFLVVDEFRMNDARNGANRMADKLKNMITEPTLTIRGMRANQVELPSYTNFIFLSNRQDVVRLDAGDRRYNIAPRQEVKLLDAYPTIQYEIKNIEQELYGFAGILSTYMVDEVMARTCLNNLAKNTMRALTLSVHDEFLDSYRAGDFSYFVDVLDIALTNTFEAGTIASAQRLVRGWLFDAVTRGWSIATSDQLRQIYLAYAQPQPAPSSREFMKACQRAGFTTDRRRDRTKEAVRGYVVQWNTPRNELDAYAQDYLDKSDHVAIAKADQDRAQSNQQHSA